MIFSSHMKPVYAQHVYFEDFEILKRVGDHFPRPYDANFLRPGNGRKIDFSGGGPLFGELTMIIF